MNDIQLNDLYQYHHNISSYNHHIIYQYYYWGLKFGIFGSLFHIVDDEQNFSWWKLFNV